MLSHAREDARDAVEAMNPVHTLKMGTAGQFRILREGLLAHRFQEPVICARAGCPSLFDFKTTFEDQSRDREIHDATDLLIRLLMDGEPVESGSFTSLLSRGLGETLIDLNVVKPDPKSEGHLRSTVFLYPVHGIYVVSDRTIEFRDEGGEAPADVVYPAITANTRRFLRCAPETPCERLLDLCSGTGIAALRAAKRFAGHAWSCDITGRAAHFAEFARRLNGIENVTVARGDLYEAVPQLQFDRILAHPPYVPAYGMSRQYYFRDGGDDGEQILRRIIEGVPAALLPGGRLYCQTMATDREGEKFEDRIRKWLGPHSGEFDVVLVSEEEALKPDIGPKKSPGGGKTRDPRRELFEALHVTGVFYGTVVLEKHAAPRPVVTARAEKSPAAGSAAIEWLVDFEQRMGQPGAILRLLENRPRLSEEARLIVTHRFKEGQLQPDRFEIRVGDPFRIDAQCQPWVALLLGYCDGARTGMEIYEQMLRDGAITEELPRGEFASILKLLLSGAVLELQQLPPPRSARRGA